MDKHKNDSNKVRQIELPSDTLLSRYNIDAHHTDCYIIDINTVVTQEQFIIAFYTSPLFKFERLLLKLLVARPSSDKQVELLASAQRDSFAAWTVEDRSCDQLLMCDYQRRTRSWLKTAKSTHQNTVSTRLFFGSAVVPTKNRRTGKQNLSIIFKLLLCFHKLYSKALLNAAASQLATCKLPPS